LSPRADACRASHLHLKVPAHLFNFKLLQRLSTLTLVPEILLVVAPHGTAIPIPLSVLTPYLFRPGISPTIHSNKLAMVDDALTLMPTLCASLWMLHAEAAPFVRRVTW